MYDLLRIETILILYETILTNTKKEIEHRETYLVGSCMIKVSTKMLAWHSR